MKLIVLEDAAAIGQAVGDLVCGLLRQKPGAVLGLATGASPVPSYQRMIARYQAGEVSFRDAVSFNLDEYCGLPEQHENSYRAFMDEQLFSQVDIQRANTHFLDGNCADEAAESRRFAAQIAAAGGIDLQILGIGHNGHIGFNEPAEQFRTEAFKVKLADSTIAANSQYFTDVPMPRFAMTMGVGMILRAKQIVLIATGEGKAKAVQTMAEGEVTPLCPASALQNHPNAAVYLDPAAASLLGGRR